MLPGGDGGDFAKTYDGYSAAKRRWANASYMRCALILVQEQVVGFEGGREGDAGEGEVAQTHPSDS